MDNSAGASSLLGSLGRVWGSILVIGYAAVATVPLVRIDLREHRLPNVWTLPGWVAASVGVLLQWGITAQFPVAAVLAGVLALVLFGAFALVAGMGMGDVKLAVPLAVGLGLLGGHTPLIGLVVAFVAGGLAASVTLLRTRRRDAQLAFGPWLLVGFWSAAVGELSGGVHAGQLG
ncbi:prepilin peptidase [Gulosibacter sp. ACHW.36C]|uniref:Prepilin peptidase n=1 Tax=Gulosibacter sediminis TaxID=1729695 RepID=A0ABY4N1D3_9MICO|nr:prepilin peptidase [Gulosibacter sediminis]UQN15760.1 prepilin peptidase [Gulosibacter sediminis]